MATFPITLPAPNASGYAVNPVDQTARTEMEVGAARTRRRTLARNDKVSLSWTFKDAEFATFRTWFDNAAECAGGASWFTISLPIGSGGLVSVEARFVGPFKAAHLMALNWNVSADVEIR